MSNLPPFSPTTLFYARVSLHVSSSSSYTCTHAHTHVHAGLRSSLGSRCYPRAIRAYYIYVFVATSPTCVGRNQGQERNRPAMAPRAIDFTHHDDDEDTKGIARGNLYSCSCIVLFFNTNTADLWIQRRRFVIAKHSRSPETWYLLAHWLTDVIASLFI